MNDVFAQARPGSGGRGSLLVDRLGEGGQSGAGLPAGFWRGPWGEDGEERPSGAQLDGAACPHCREPAAVALPGGGGWCGACGGLVTPSGEAETICPRCALPHPATGHRGCSGAGPERPPKAGSNPDGLGERLRELAAERLGAAPAAHAGRYVAAVRAGVTAGASGEVLFAGAPEPFLLVLPDRSLVVSAGVIRALEDEAQLAFLLGREAALERDGWIDRRYRTGEPAAFWSLWRRRDDEPLVRALDLTCRVGFGAEAEQRADREALAALASADYDPQAGARALALLDRASRGTGRFRVSRVRSRLLGRTLADIGRPAVARINREVYRRALAPVRDAMH